MFRRTQAGEGNNEGARDERLSVLLRQWPEMEPKAGFDTAVWRQIRAVPAAQPAGLWEWWLDWFVPHPVRAGLAVVSAALAIGLVAGVAIPGDGHTGLHNTHALLHPRTLMGTYLALSEEGHP